MLRNTFVHTYNAKTSISPDVEKTIKVWSMAFIFYIGAVNCSLLTTGKVTID